MVDRGIGRSLIRFSPSPPRWHLALQAAIAMALPVVTGTALGNQGAGLQASIGAFTALYCTAISRRDRVRVLPLIIAGMVLASALGVLGSGSHLLGLVMLVVVASAAVLLVTGFRVGPPGALMFTLVCGISTQIAAPTELGGPGENGLVLIALIAAGAVTAYLVVIFPLLLPRVWRAQGERTPVSVLFGGFTLTANDRISVLRTIAAVILAALVAVPLDQHRGYWIICAALAILSIGHSRRMTVQRGIHRVLGTVVGSGLFLVLAGIGPQGYWLALTLGLLQAFVELVVVRHYALALCGITPLSLLIASAAHASVEAVALERVLDTLAGALVAMLVLLVAQPGKNRDGA